MEERTEDTTAREAGDEKPQGVNKALVIGAAVAIVAVVVGMQLCQSGRFQPIGKGTAAPAFSFPDLEGNEVALADHRGKVVFLNIWATWCDPCREEMPSMERLYKKLKGRPFEILAVSVDSDPTPVKPFVEEFKLTFPILLDTRRKITRLYRATGVPETFIIDSKGVIAEKVIGARSWSKEENVEFITKLVEEAEAPAAPVEAEPAPAQDGQGSK